MTYTQQKQLEQNALAPCNCTQSIELERKINMAIGNIKFNYLFSSNKTHLKTLLSILERSV
jgi:hypothetical protein